MAASQSGCQRSTSAQFGIINLASLESCCLSLMPVVRAATDASMTCNTTSFVKLPPCSCDTSSAMLLTVQVVHLQCQHSKHMSRIQFHQMSLPAITMQHSLTSQPRTISPCSTSRAHSTVKQSQMFSRRASQMHSQCNPTPLH